jgi:hypothetical protein
LIPAHRSDGSGGVFGIALTNTTKEQFMFGATQKTAFVEARRPEGQRAADAGNRIELSFLRGWTDGDNIQVDAGSSLAAS